MTKIDYGTKLSDVKGKYLATSGYKKLTSEILDGKLKQKELANKPDISNHVNNAELKTKNAALETKAELKVEKNRIVKCKHMI